MFIIYSHTPVFNYITQFDTSSPKQMARFSAASTDPESAREIVCRAAFSAAQKIKGHRWNSSLAKCGHQIMQMHTRWETNRERESSSKRHRRKPELTQTVNTISAISALSHICLFVCLQCASEAGLSANVDQCMTTAKGTKLQLNAEQITKRYSPSFVPTIVYDHVSQKHTHLLHIRMPSLTGFVSDHGHQQVFNQQLQDNSIHDFRSTVCYLLNRQISLPEC